MKYKVREGVRDGLLRMEAASITCTLLLLPLSFCQGHGCDTGSETMEPQGGAVVETGVQSGESSAALAGLRGPTTSMAPKISGKT